MSSTHRRILLGGAAFAGLSLAVVLACKFWLRSQQLIGHRLGQPANCQCLVDDTQIFPPEIDSETQVKCASVRNGGNLGQLAADGTVAVDDRPIRVFPDEPKLIVMSSRKKVVATLSEHPSIAVASPHEDNPTVVRIMGASPGETRIILHDEDGCVEIRSVKVLDPDTELFELERARFDKRKEILQQLIRQVRPTADVEVAVVVRPIKNATRESILANSTVLLMGTVARDGDIRTVVDLANAVFVETLLPSDARPDAIRTNATIVNRLRVEPQTVELNVMLALVDRTETVQAGFKDYEAMLARFRTVPGAGLFTDSPKLTFAVKDTEPFVRLLQEMRTRKILRVVAEPRIVTLSGRPANFVDGGQIPVITSSTGGSNISYLQSGVIVNLVPIVLENGNIQMELAASFSRPNSQQAATTVAGGNRPVRANPVSMSSSTGSVASTPRLMTYGASLVFVAENGQTVAIAGMTHKAMVDNGLGDTSLAKMPLIGSIISEMGRSEHEFDVVILITPSSPACQPPTP